MASTNELSCPSFTQGVHTRQESQEDISRFNVFDDKVFFEHGEIGQPSIRSQFLTWRDFDI